MTPLISWLLIGTAIGLWLARTFCNAMDEHAAWLVQIDAEDAASAAAWDEHVASLPVETTPLFDGLAAEPPQTVADFWARELAAELDSPDAAARLGGAS